MDPEEIFTDPQNTWSFSSSSFLGDFFGLAQRAPRGTLCLAKKACSLVVVAGAVVEERGREEREETRLSRDRVSPTPGTQHRPVGGGMGHLSIKTPNPKCRLCWCLIELIYSLEIQSVMLVFSTPLVN